MTSLLNLLLRLARCASGTASVEAAIMMPLVIVLMAGSTDFGRAFAVSSTADKSLRDAARYLARVPCDSEGLGVCTSAAAVCGWGLTNAKNLAVYGKLTVSAGDKPLVANWSTSDITLTQPTDCGALPNPAVIRLEATVPFSGIMLNAVGLSNAMTMHVEHEQRWIGE
jgi:Flp pilus assembly protein TadG